MVEFFLPRGEGRFIATEHTAGPWSAQAQHGGPPAALLGRAMEQLAPRPEMMLARFVAEILGPVPLGELTVQSRVARPGRSVELLEAVLVAGGREVMAARGWRILRTEQRTGAPAPAPAVGESVDDPSTFGRSGYLEAVEWRSVRGGFGQPGPAAAWSRLRGAVVAGEEPTGLQRVLAVADSGNGLSWALDLTSTYFINPELTVHLHREAVGDWILLDAQTTVSPGGVGLATSVLSDGSGELGRGAQALLIAPRPSAA